MKPLVSILIPAYNAEKFLADTIRSALAQSWLHKEIIVVDDGSRDETLALARQYESATIKVVSQENQGAAAARNKAWSLAQGDYIQWLDADDLLSLDKITKQVEALNVCPGPRTLLAAGWAPFACRHYKARFIPTALWCDLSPVEWLLRKMGQNLHMQTATWLVSRELTEAAGPWDTRLLGDDDGEYFCRVLLASEGTRFVPEAKVFYRITPSSRLSYIGRSRRKMEAHFLSMKMHINYIRSLEDSPRVRAACVNYLQTWLPHFYLKCPEIVSEAHKLAAALGGKLRELHFSWKYAWLERLFGWGTANSVQLSYNRWKSSIIRSWDKTMYSIETR